MLMVRLVRWSIALLALLAAAALIAAVAGRPVQGTLTTVPLGGLGEVPVGIEVGIVQALLLCLVSGVGTVVAFYSARNLTGQHRLTRFGLLEVAVVVALAISVTTVSLPILALAWTLASLAIAGLVAHAGTPQAQSAAGQVRARLLVGDALLWAGVVVIGLGLGTWSLRDLPEAVAGASAAVVAVAALLVVGAGVVRSAQVPAHRWLPETAEAPSPVSALLHAGLVNGVGVLALLMWPLIAAAGPARVLLVAVGAATAVIATAIMRARADLKGRLASSTSSQMGYLAIQIGIGLPVAALLHVIGHGVWKAAQFLGAGDAVARVRRGDATPARPLTPGLLAATGTGAVAAVLVAAVVPLAGWPALVAPAELLPLIVAVGAAWLGLTVIARSPFTAPARALAGAVIVLGAVGYLLALRGMGHLLEPVVGEPAAWSSREGWVAAAVALVLVAVGVAGAVVDRRARAGRLPRLARWAGRAALRPITVRERLAGRPVIAQALPPVSIEDADLARQQIGIGAASVGSLYPLTTFVASNPLAGLEDLDVAAAGSVAADLWGSRPGPGAPEFRRALAEGRVTLGDVDHVLAQELGDAASGWVPRGGEEVALVDVARHLLTRDDATPWQRSRAAAALQRAAVPTRRVVRTPMEAIGVPVEVRTRIDQMGHHCCARSLSGVSWPGASGPWRELRETAPVLDRLLGLEGAGEIVAALPDEPAEATATLMEHLGLDPADRPLLIGRLLARHPGWPSHLRWRLRHDQLGDEAGIAASQGPDGADLLVELVATRLALDVIAAEALAPRLLARPVDPADLVADEPPADLPGLLASAVGDGDDLEGLSDRDIREAAQALQPLTSGGLARLRAAILERAYERTLLGPIGDRAAGTLDVSAHAEHGPRVAGQIVTCIDVRSERLRRNLEEVGPWETFGAAGFFGIPVRYESASGTVSERTPALLRPVVTVREHAPSARRAQGGSDALARSVRAIESAPGLVFGWAEAVGWLLSPVVFARTLWPRAMHAVGRILGRRLGSPKAGWLEIEADTASVAAAAAAFLTSTGLRDFAPVVVLCGHGATVTNNPHVAAYDCGACGGAAGDVSARTLARALNDGSVRSLLRRDGIDIPEDTIFVPAVHDTTTDRVHLLAAEDGPRAHASVLERFRADADVAGDRVRAERIPLLPDSADSRRRLSVVEGRAADWAQPRPEWGLAGAAAIVVGPRSLTEGLDLQGRVFLQSYRADLDPDGAALRQLLAAPVVVAQWITAQYWASLTDPERFGAGDKTTHNVMGDGTRLSAVVSGARGDLRVGLPWQAVSPTAPRPGASADDPWGGPTRHQPQRLLVVVHASPERIESAMDQEPSFGRLVRGGWILVRSVDPETGIVSRRLADGQWHVGEAIEPALVAGR
ncbi:MAG: DUF2309 family protein [Actinomycetales bacterium]|nr:DUF2309 family protein [Actinomycetales bacterium]